MKLLIVESPAKAKTITKYLDDKYKVVASVGHIRDLPKNNKKAIDIDGGFLPHYEIKQEKKKVVSELKKLAKDGRRIIVVGDHGHDEVIAIANQVVNAIVISSPKEALKLKKMKKNIQLIKQKAVQKNIGSYNESNLCVYRRQPKCTATSERFNPELC